MEFNKGRRTAGNAMRPLFAVLLLAACASPAPPAPDRPQVETVRTELGEQAHALLTEATHDGFSGAVIAEANGELILAAGYGLADREANRPFTIDTIAQIGSITNPSLAQRSPIWNGEGWSISIT